MVSPEWRDAPAAAVPGTVGGGRYVVRERLGQGGAAEVFRATDRVLHVDRAVKRLSTDNAVLRVRFLAEARALARLRHPAVVQIFDYGEDVGPDGGPRPWFAMELAEGGSLATRLRHGPLAVLEALRVAFEVLAGLSALHGLGLVHRDVKPGNVLFGAGGEVWVGDLGIVSGRNVGRDSGQGEVEPLGTVGYAAPELRGLGGGVDARADLYGVGATLVAMLTARTPPDLALAAADPSLLAGVPVDLRPIVLRATHPDPAARYASAREMAEHVAEAVDAVAIPLGERARRESHLRWFDHVAEAAGRSATTPSLAPLREVDAPSASAGTPRAPAREAPAVGRSWWWAAALAAAFTCGALLARWVLPTP